MQCAFPLMISKNRDNSWRITRFQSDSHGAFVPCGRCMPCRLNRKREWGVRCLHESQMHDASSFLTLTFDDEHCPQQISKRDLQLFMKRLRKSLSPHKVRYYACGEYGDYSNRPHYHVSLFGYDFPDKVSLDVTGTQEHPLYFSEQLAAVWPFGHHSIGSITFDSAQYVAGYVSKKLTGAYEKHDPDGVVLQSEFGLSSTRPGIGASWFYRYGDSVVDKGFCYVNGSKCAIPSYYKKRLFSEQQKIRFREVHGDAELIDLRHPDSFANDEYRNDAVLSLAESAAKNKGGF